MGFHIFIDIMFKIILLLLLIIAHKVFKEEDKWMKNKSN